MGGFFSPITTNPVITDNWGGDSQPKRPGLFSRLLGTKPNPLLSGPATEPSKGPSLIDPGTSVDVHGGAAPKVPTETSSLAGSLPQDDSSLPEKVRQLRMQSMPPQLKDLMNDPSWNPNHTEPDQPTRMAPPSMQADPYEQQLIESNKALTDQYAKLTAPSQPSRFEQHHPRLAELIKIGSRVAPLAIGATVGGLTGVGFAAGGEAQGLGETREQELREREEKAREAASLRDAMMRGQESLARIEQSKASLWGEPQEMTDANGNLVMVQTNKATGATRPVQGYGPAKPQQDFKPFEGPDAVARDDKGNVVGVLGTNLRTGQPEVRPIPGGYSFGTPAKAAGPTQEQNKLAYQGIVGKLAESGLPVSPAGLNKSLDLGARRGIITPQERAQALGYMAANPNAATNLTVHIAGQQATDAMKEKGKYYLYNGQMVTGDKVPAGADAMPIKDPQAFRTEASNTNIIQKSFNHVAGDNLSIFDDPKARAVLATALDENQARSMGILVAGTGGSISLPSGTGKIIDQLLENHAVPPNLQRDVKNYIVDYWGMRDKLLAMQMEMQGGKIGRGNAVFFNAMLAQLPGPGTADSVMARRQLNLLSETMSGLKEQYGDLADIEPKQVQGDIGQPRTGGGAKLSPAGQQYLNSILGH